jgi:hypothetical protein
MWRNPHKTKDGNFVNKILYAKELLKYAGIYDCVKEPPFITDAYYNTNQTPALKKFAKKYIYTNICFLIKPEYKKYFKKELFA